MNILKIFGIAAVIHAFALVLIFANPGCSSLSKSGNSTDIVDESESAAVVSVPNLSDDMQSAPADDAASTQMNAFGGSPITTAPIAFNPDAPAVATDSRYRPTRPGTTVATALKAEPVNDVVPVSTYTVVRGDSLWSIAKRNGLSVAELAESNNLRASAMLKVGQKLIIPGKSLKVTSSLTPAPKRKTAKPVTRPAKSSITHVVKSGQTLGGIARKYDVRVGTLATANNISDPAKIRPGQKLIIPGWKKPEPKKPAPVVAKPAPAPIAPVQEQPKVVETNEAPILFVAPPVDKPLDEGFESDAGEAPVIQVEEAN